MSEVKPTITNLQDPYVLQLIANLAQRDDKIEELTADWKELDAELVKAWDSLREQDQEIQRLTAVVRAARKQIYMCPERTVPELYKSLAKLEQDDG